jgi:ABC-type transport system substrate-binding protein
VRGRTASSARRAAAAPLLALAAAACLFGGSAGCTNNPYPDEDADRKILYLVTPEPPRTLDPAEAYSTVDHSVTGPVYETLLEYHFLKRPYQLIPGIATAVPEPRPLGDGRVAYRFELRDGLRFQDDDCFEAVHGEGRRTRPVRAADVAFELMRIADPAVNSPVISTFWKIAGMRAFTGRLEERREDEAFAALRIDLQYEAAGPVEGLRVLSDRELEIVLDESYPQILYWFAMEFTTPVPWEAIVHWDGEDGRDLFDEHPVGAGPYVLTRYDKRSRIVLDENPNWYGVRDPDSGAPGATYPSEGEPGDREAGRLDPEYVGKPLPFIERIELRYEKETIPAFNKFLQGYYDASGIIQESFDKIVQEGDLSPEMRERGMTLEKSVSPDVYYLGFNMDDPVVGSAAGERGRKLRQAMSLVIDTEEYTRIFTNGRGVPAQSPIPPGLFGYDPDYRNPFRQVDLERARRLLAEAGYRGGVDPETGKALKLSFDTGDTSSRGRLRYLFFVEAWKRLGLDVEIAATNYNQFQEKVRKGAYQIFMWGWVADYPDPENFLFLLWGPMARSASQGPNTANFSDPAYDALFLEMRNRSNDARRLELIRRLRAIVERERPWIELTHSESYGLYQPWMRNVKPFGMSFFMTKYRDLDPEQRKRLRAEWNEPVLWPALVLGVLFVVVVTPGIVTFYRERQ